MEMEKNQGKAVVPEDIVVLEDAIESTFGMDIAEGIQATFDLSATVLEDFRGLVQTNPSAAVDEFEAYIERARVAAGGENYGFCEAIADGPAPDLIAPILDAAAHHYDSMTEAEQQQLLRKELGYLDEIRDYASGHVA